MLAWNWEEVYCSADLGEAMAREDILREHGVKFKTKAVSGFRRLDMNMRGGMESAALSRGGTAPVTDTYCIYVKRDQAESSKHLLSEQMAKRR